MGKIGAGVIISGGQNAADAEQMAVAFVDHYKRPMEIAKKMARRIIDCDIDTMIHMPSVGAADRLALALTAMGVDAYVIDHDAEAS